jgi:hypothetical protein
MRCLAILLDPGRLKRGVGPNRKLGPPLAAWRMYTLTVGTGMIDLFGSPLREAVYKHFLVTNVVRERIEIEQWEIVPPETNSRRPLVTMFPRPLDWALLSKTITFASALGQPIDGTIAVDQHERRWSFTPALPWGAGDYHVCVSSDLEDVCGNNLIAPFDRSLRSRCESKPELAAQSIPFHIA